MDLAARSWLYRIHLIACIRFPVYRSGGLSWRERVAPADCRPPHISWIGRQALPLRCGLFDSRAADGHARVQGRRRDWHERLPSFARHLRRFSNLAVLDTEYSQVHLRFFVGCAAGRGMFGRLQALDQYRFGPLKLRLLRRPSAPAVCGGAVTRGRRLTTDT